LATRRPKHNGEYNVGILYKFDSNVKELVNNKQRLIDYNTPFYIRFSFVDNKTNEAGSINTLAPGYESTNKHTIIETTSDKIILVNEEIEINGRKLLIISAIPTNINSIKNLRGNYSETLYTIELS
jgi:hypothetical protein